MTTYILAGGCDGDYPEYMAQLSRVVHGIVSKPRILSCGFSGSDAQSQNRFSKRKKMFEDRFGVFESFTMATKEDFIEEVRQSDVIYFHGGSTNSLSEAMRSYPDIKKEFTGKIIIGSSAGANYLSSYCFSPVANDIGQSGGILDVAIVVHYGSPGFNEMTFEPGYWERAVRLVGEVSGKAEVLLLPEGTFTVIKK